MNANERQNLKDRIEADLKLLINESWHNNVVNKLEEALNILQSVWLEGYDD